MREKYKYEKGGIELDDITGSARHRRKQISPIS